MIFSIIKNKKTVKQPLMVKIRSFNSLINEESVNLFIETLTENILHPKYDENSLIPFPLYVKLLFECYKRNINCGSLSPKECIILLTKISLFSEKYFAFCLVNTLSYQFLQTNSLEDNHKLKLKLDASFDEVNSFLSWGVKYHHNQIYQNTSNSFSTMEKHLGIEKNYIIKNTISLTQDEYNILNKYIIINEQDTIKGKKATSINSRYLINTLMKDNNLILNLELYDNKNNTHYTKQIMRYIKELIIYFRLLNIIECLSKNDDLITKNKIDEIINIVKHSHINDHIPIKDFSNISNKLLDKIIKLLGSADSYYCTLICKNNFIITLIKNLILKNKKK